MTSHSEPSNFTSSQPQDTPRSAHRHALQENDAASQWLGIQVLKLAPGYAQIAMVLRPEMMNGFGFTHGGMVFSLADTAFAFACNPSSGSSGKGAAESLTVASGADITFLRSSYAGQRLIATANFRAQQGRSGLFDVTVRVDPASATGEATSTEEGEVVAEFRGRSRTISQRVPATDVPASSANSDRKGLSYES